MLIAVLGALFVGSTAPWWWSPLKGLILSRRPTHQSQLVPGYSGATYELICDNGSHEHQVGALLQFTSKDTARWRMLSSLDWTESFKTEPLGPHRVLLSNGPQDTWQEKIDLTFSQDFKKVTEGSISYQDPSSGRSKYYTVVGSRQQ